MKPRVFAQVYLLLQGFSRGHGGVNTGVGGQQGLTSPCHPTLSPSYLPTKIPHDVGLFIAKLSKRGCNLRGLLVPVWVFPQGFHRVQTQSWGPYSPIQLIFCKLKHVLAGLKQLFQFCAWTEKHLNVCLSDSWNWGLETPQVLLSIKKESTNDMRSYSWSSENYLEGN